MIYGMGWTGARVLERVALAVREATTPNAIVTVDENGQLTGPVDGLDLIRIAELALGKGTELHKHFNAFVLSARTGDSIGATLAARGWSSSTHARKRHEAAEIIAEWVNMRRLMVLDCGLPDIEGAPHGANHPVTGRHSKISAA